MYTNKTLALGTAPLGKPHRPQHPQWRGKSPMFLCCSMVRVLLKYFRGMQVRIWIYSLVKAQSAASFALYEAQLWAILAACLCAFDAVRVVLARSMWVWHPILRSCALVTMRHVECRVSCAKGSGSVIVRS